MKKDMSIDDYINVAKTDIYLYLFIFIASFLILLYISYRINCYYIYHIELIVIIFYCLISFFYFQYLKE